MIVELTTAQVEAVTEALERCGLGWATEKWSPLWTLRGGRTATYECLMPAIGWQQTLAALLELSVGPLGGNRADARHAALKARERIAEGLNVYGAHPALYGVGMVGLHSDVLPVWQRPDVRPPTRLYDILPMGGRTSSISCRATTAASPCGTRWPRSRCGSRGRSIRRRCSTRLSI